MPRMNTYLVFEAQGDTGSGAPRAHWEAMERAGVDFPPRSLAPYVCLGAVKAKDENDAVKAVMASTRRIGKYAVVEATIVDFKFDPSQEAEGQRVELNP